MKRPGIYFCWALQKMLTRTETGSEIFDFPTKNVRIKRVYWGKQYISLKKLCAYVITFHEYKLWWIIKMEYFYSRKLAIKEINDPRNYNPGNEREAQPIQKLQIGAEHKVGAYSFTNLAAFIVTVTYRIIIQATLG